MLDQKRAVEIYNKSKKNSNSIPKIYHQFSLQDLVGERIIGTREVFRKREGNPEYLDVVDFESGRTLIAGNKGWHDGSTCHMYLVETDGKKAIEKIIRRLSPTTKIFSKILENPDYLDKVDFF